MAANSSYQSAPTISAFSSTTTSPRNDSNASYSISFSQNVTGLDSNDFENAGSATDCSYAISGSGSSYTLSITSCSDGTIQPRLKANSVSGSAFAGPASAATASTSITKDSTAPTASVTAATILASGNASVQSSETGTAYLVNASVTVTNEASITSAADNLQNSVSISTANTNTNLLASGLISGTYKVYTADAAGNLSVFSTNSITIKPAAPGTPDLEIGSDLGTSSTDNNTADDTPTFSVASVETGTIVLLTATPISGNPVTCSFTAMTSSGSCTFSVLSNSTYSLTAVQSRDGISSDSSTALSNVVINKATISTPATPNLADASDSGSSNSDDITNVTTPTINASGTFTGTAKVNATKAGSSTVSCTISSNACQLGTLSNGIWAISVTDSDTAGNAATSLTLTITIDSAAPSTPTITSQTVSDKESITIQVSDTGTAFLNRWTLVSTTPTSATTRRAPSLQAHPRQV